MQETLKIRKHHCSINSIFPPLNVKTYQKNFPQKCNQGQESRSGRTAEGSMEHASSIGALYPTPIATINLEDKVTSVGGTELYISYSYSFYFTFFFFDLDLGLFGINIFLRQLFQCPCVLKLILLSLPYILCSSVAFATCSC